MQGDLISRSALIEKLQELSEHNLDGKMYISNAIYLIEKQPTAYYVEKLVEELEAEKDSTYERCVKGMFDAVFKDIINKISDGGKE